MRIGYINEPYQIIVDTPEKLTGLTDVIFTVFNSGGVAVTGSPFSATEIASSGVYTSSWTPTVAGDYIIEVSSVAQGISEISSAVRINETSNTDIVDEINLLENLSASDVWTAVNRTLTDKTGFELTTAQHDAIADAVQGAIIDEGDGQTVIDAIVQAIGNQNIDEVALVAAVRADMERVGGTLAQILTASTASNTIQFRVIN